MFSITSPGLENCTCADNDLASHKRLTCSIWLTRGASSGKHMSSQWELPTDAITMPALIRFEIHKLVPLWHNPIAAGSGSEGCHLEVCIGRQHAESLAHGLLTAAGEMRPQQQSILRLPDSQQAFAAPRVQAWQRRESRRRAQPLFA